MTRSQGLVTVSLKLGQLPAVLPSGMLAGCCHRPEFVLFNLKTKWEGEVKNN